MIAAKARGRVYRRIDTHWTQRGALIAYNALMQAMGRPDWASPEHRMAWTTTQVVGDLARMAGRPGEMERVQVMDLPPLPATTTQTPITGLDLPSGGQAMPPYVIETGRPGPRILVIGDSYTTGAFFTPLLARAAGATAWIHMDLCGFDERVFDRVRPDFVLLIPTERMAMCS